MFGAVHTEKRRTKSALKLPLECGSNPLCKHPTSCDLSPFRLPGRYPVSIRMGWKSDSSWQSEQRQCLAIKHNKLRKKQAKPTTNARTNKTRRPILSKWTIAVGGKGQVVSVSRWPFKLDIECSRRAEVYQCPRPASQDCGAC